MKDVLKRPIILVPGGPGLDSRSFFPWLDGLKEDFSLLLSDLYGVHLPVSERGGMDGCMSRFQQLVRGCGMPPVVLAHSWGAVVIGQAIQRQLFPKESLLILVCPAPLTYADLKITSQKFAQTMPKKLIRELVQRMSLGGNHPEIMKSLLPYYCYDSASPPSMVFETYDLDAFGGLAREVEGFDHRSSLEHFPKTLKISATADQFFECIDAYPGELKLIPQAQHYPFAENPELFCKVVKEWIDDHFIPWRS